MPTFAAHERLARYIKPEYRKDYGEIKRPKVPAFMDVETPDGLSVNSLELATESQVAAIYRAKFNEGSVALSSPTIEDYNRAAAGRVKITGPNAAPKPMWTNNGPEGEEESYKHDAKNGNSSHCLVRYFRLLEESAQFFIARKLAAKPTYKVFDG